MRQLCIVVIFLVAVAMTMCAPTPEPVSQSALSIEADVEAIQRVREQEVTAYSSDDLDHFISTMSDDVVVDPPYYPAVIGREAARSVIATLFERATYDVTYPVEELVVFGDWAFERGVWTSKITPKDGGEPTEASFGGVQIYRRQSDGSWKITRLIWNTDAPPSQ